MGGRANYQKKYSRKGKLNEKNSCTPSNPKKMFMLWPKKIHTGPSLFLIIHPKNQSLSRPFFFTTLFRLNIVINQFCDFFTRNKRMNVHQEVLNVLLALFKRWWKRSYFSFKLQTHHQFSCQGFMFNTESANLLLWMRPIKHLLFIVNWKCRKVRPFPTALPKLREDEGDTEGIPIHTLFHR